MEKQTEKKGSISGDRLFTWSHNSLKFILLLAFIISIINKASPMINWSIDFENTVGVAVQIITAIISLVASIIGIAISLQNEDFFGVKITKLYALRVNKHYSILEIILISIFLCVLNLVFYMAGLIIAVIGTLFVSICFLVQVVHTEVPIMAKNEDAIMQILKNNLIFCYLNKAEASINLKDAIKYLLYRKNLKDIYEFFKEEHDLEYNQYVLLKLLEFQHDLAFELKDKYEENEHKVIGGSLTENVFDILLRHINVSDETYSEIAKNRHLLTRVLFRIHELPSTQEQLLEKIGGLYQYLSFIPVDRKQQIELISDIITILTAATIKVGDLSIIKSIRKQLSNSTYCLSKEGPALDVFAVLSMYLYYLSCSEKDYPAELKKDIQTFIREGNIIEDYTKIASWRLLFSKAADILKVDYNRFISLVEKNSNTLEYYLFGNSAKFIILSRAYLSQWFLTHCINASKIYSLDYSSFINKYPEIKPYLKDFGNRCFDENKNFVPTIEMKNIVEFYSTSEECFVFFEIDEAHDHRLFETVNRIKLEELKHDSEQARKIDNTEFAAKVRNEIETSVKQEWGFDPDLPIENEERYFSVLFKKYPEAINFEEGMLDYTVRSVLSDIEKATKKTVLYNDGSFEEGIRKILSKKLRYTTKNIKYTIPQFYISDEGLKEKFQDVCNVLEVFESNLLGMMSMVTENGFRFNCKVENVELRDLTEDELAKQVTKHQRADGQFVLDGVFLPKEEITKIIQKKFAVLSVIIRHQVNSSEDTVFELNPYSDGSSD